MPTVADFIRRTPPAALRTYFNTFSAQLPSDVNWDGPANDVVAPLLRAVDSMDDASRLRVMNDADRVGAMTDEPGQSALYAVTTEHDLLDDQANGHARAIWMFINHPESFRHAEEVRYADDKRYGKMWDAFVGQPGCTVARDIKTVGAFERAVAEQFDSRNVEVEICDRSRPVTAGDDATLIQATVYREGRPGDVLEFVDGKLARRPHKPVIEAALTYEPANGTIEVVAAARESREMFVCLFAEHLLGAAFKGERLRVRQYMLDQLQQPFDFPTDAEDNIESVRVSLLRLMPLDTQGERLTLECTRGASRTIWQMAEMRLAERDLQLRGYRVSRVRFTIKFHAVPGIRGGRTLPVTISMPQGCDLKDRTERERLIGEKYLRRWRLLRDV